MGYSKDVDYQSKIDEAVANGDYKSAAQYEQSRNEKIDGEGLNYAKTQKYSGWLDDTDYSGILKDQMSSGASKSAVSETLRKRIAKASGTEGLSQYAYDDIYDEAIRYIMGEGFYLEKPTYKNSYGDDLEDLLEQFLNRESFSYDIEEDELYKMYKEQYIREGNRAMEDLLGELATTTGGIASSYAVSAASQARENYTNKLTDKIPELYADAYSRYLDEIEADESTIELLQSLSNDEYDRYLDEIELYNDERELEFDIESFRSEQEASEKEAEYEQEQDRIDYALRRWETLGYLDEESASILGLPAGLHTSDYDYKKAQQYNLYNR